MQPAAPAKVKNAPKERKQSVMAPVPVINVTYGANVETAPPKVIFVFGKQNDHALNRCSLLLLTCLPTGPCRRPGVWQRSCSGLSAVHVWTEVDII